jgi:hypothetical protein
MSSSLPLSVEDLTAVLALVTRYQRVFMQHGADLKLKAEVEARLAEAATQFAQLKAALSIFGFDTAAGGFAEIRELVGDDIYWAALQRGGATRPPVQLPEPERASTQEDRDDEEPSSEDDVPDSEPVGSTPESTATVRDLVLDNLKAAKEEGATAAAIRADVELRRHAKLHDKTVGMTLYRLSQDGLARREKRTWFYVPPTAETKNPGGETPGLSTVSN